MLNKSAIVGKRILKEFMFYLVTMSVAKIIKCQ